MNAEIMKVCNCILANKMLLNNDKTVYLLVSGKKTVTATNQLYLFNSAI